MSANVDGSAGLLLTGPYASTSRGVDIERWLKYVTAGAIGLQVLGLLIVNTYLLPYGVSESDLLRPRYALVGGVCVGTVVVATIVPLYVYRIVRLYVVGSGNRLHDRAFALVPAVGMAYTSVAFFDAVVPFGLPLALMMQLAATVLGLSLLRLVKFVADPVWMKFRISPKRPRNMEITGPTKQAIVGGVALLTALSVASFLFGYSVIVFRHISESIGGGRVPPARLVVDPLGAHALHAAGVDLGGPERNVTPRLNVVFAGSQVYVVGVPGTLRTVRLDAERVVAAF